jgi:hypothetical protein
MGLFDRYRKRRAIVAFSKRLGPALSERFGQTPYYTADQIGDVVSSRKFRRHREYLAYAYCLFMSQKDFDALDTGVDAPGGFDTLRSEAYGFIGPGPGIAQPASGAYGDSFQGPSPGDFDPGDGGSGL